MLRLNILKLIITLFEKELLRNSWTLDLYLQEICCFTKLLSTRQPEVFHRNLNLDKLC
jgi:hypothetical protein